MQKEAFKNQKRKSIFFPRTRLGRLSFRLILVSFLLFVIGNLIVFLQGPIANQTFFSNPLLSIPMLSAGTAAVISFFAGIIAIVKYKERAISIFISSLIGFIVLFFILGEILVQH